MNMRIEIKEVEVKNRNNGMKIEMEWKHWRNSLIVDFVKDSNHLLYSLPFVCNVLMLMFSDLRLPHFVCIQQI